MEASVSVIIPCYNSSNTLRRAIQSVIEQTLRPAEILLINDGSEDNTLEILLEFQNLYGSDWIKVISLEQNSGVSIARNTAWDLASQEYIAFLDSDDSWHHRKLEIQYNWMSSHPEVALTGHPCTVLKNGIVNSQLNSGWNFRTINLYRLLFSNCFPTPSVMLLRKIPYRFDPNKRYAEDYSLWLNIVSDGNTTTHLDLHLAYLYKNDFGAGGLSGNMWNMELGELEMYYSLFKEGGISLFLVLLTVTFSLLKHIRRVLIVQLSIIKW
jgi:glycosyltransferase involved in cell wall biosynthesis